MFLMRKMAFLAFTGFLLVFYNNCSQPEGIDQGSSSPLERQANGTPYGGKLKPGNYIPTNNQYCDSSSEEKIHVVSKGIKDYEVQLEIPCENRSISLKEDEYGVSSEKDRILFQNVGFAHESTKRAQSKEHYKVACRTTEADFGAEILVYGPAPVYTFEHISLESDFTLYETTTNFFYNSFGQNRHSFEGDSDVLELRLSENGQRFIGFWNSDNIDTTNFQRMICEILDDTPVDEW